MNCKISAQHYQLLLDHPFTTSRYTVNVQDTLIVSISDGEVIGYGEATVNPYYGTTIQQLKAAIFSIEEDFKNHFGTPPEVLWERIAQKLKHNYFALCAIDCAYWDYYARKHKRTLRSFWNTTTDNLPKTNYTIGIDELSIMKDKIKKTPWPIYKIKLGVPDDLQIIKQLRDITNAIFRIDANCAWRVDETIKKSKALRDLGVEFIEQPLAADNWEGMREVKDKSKLPIIADESCKTLEDVEKCAEVFHGINIKLMKCGGITPALKMIQKARTLGIKVMIGCMTESSVGISTIAQLAPLLDYLDADGAMLLKNDVAIGVTFKNGTILYADSFGSGVQLK